MQRQLHRYLSIIFIFSFFLISSNGFAQSPDDPSEFDPAVPIDGGISLLLAAGAALGGRRLLKSERKRRG
jgi:hypothetical protein